MKKFTITESEKRRILNLHQNHIIAESIVITDWVSPDNKYCIFLDDLYDIENKVKIGNIFENFDYFITFLKHCCEKAEYITENIRKKLFESINSYVLTESNQDISETKIYLKDIIKEWTANPFDKEFYTGKNWSDAWEAGKETVQSGIESLKKTYSNIKDGQWTEAFKIIGQGVLFLARKLRSLLYNPIGMVLDAILIATGIGKGFQVAVWGIIVLLDIYELVSGNFEDKETSMGWRLFYLGIDIIGLVTAGAVAKSAKSGVDIAVKSFGKSEKGLELAIRNSPLVKNTAEKILKSSSGAGGVMQKVSTHLQKNAPKIYNFFKPMFNLVSKFISKLVNFLGGILSLPGKAIEKLAPASLKGTKSLDAISAAANVIVPTAGLHLYGAHSAEQQYNQLADALEDSSIEPIYDINQI